jgi:ATP-dependent protease ClpP protease subunit
MSIIKHSLIVLFALISGCASQHTITPLTDHDYKIDGKLYKDDYDQIKLIVDQHPHQRINFFVNSIGGTSGDLLIAMDAMYHHGDVHWYVQDHCDSACAIMALSTKHAQGTIRLHSFYSVHHHHIYTAPEFNQVIINRLEEYGYPRNKIDYMFRSVEELWPINIEDGVIVK